METPLIRMSKINTSRIIRSIWLQPGISRIELAQMLNLNKSTVTTLVRRLVDLGLIETQSIGAAGATGGRRPIQLQINKNWGYLLGIEIQTESFTVVITNLHGEVCLTETHAIDVRKKGLLESFIDITNRYYSLAESKEMSLIGIGVGLPGFVDHVNGTLVASIPLEIFDPVHLAAEGAKRFDFSLPIIVDNDANCGCWAEIASKTTGEREDFIFVLGEFRKHTVAMEDTRILALGMGFVIDGKVHHGVDFSAGEYRSIYFSPDHFNQLSITDEEAKRFLHDPHIDAKVVDELSRHIAFLVNTLNLKKVVIGGPIEMLEPHFARRLDERLQESWLYPGGVDCTITVSQNGPLSVAYGAAKMFMEHLITIPDLARTTNRPTVGVDLLMDVLKFSTNDVDD